MRTIPSDSPFARFRDDLLALFGLDVIGGIPRVPSTP